MLSTASRDGHFVARINIVVVSLSAKRHPRLDVQSVRARALDKLHAGVPARGRDQPAT